MAEHYSGSRGPRTLQPGIQSSHECSQKDCGCAGEPSGAVRQAQVRAQDSSHVGERVNADVLLRQEPDEEEDEEEEEDDRKKEDDDDDEGDDGYSE